MTTTDSELFLLAMDRLRQGISESHLQDEIQKHGLSPLKASQLIGDAKAEIAEEKKHGSIDALEQAPRMFRNLFLWFTLTLVSIVIVFLTFSKIADAQASGILLTFHVGAWGVGLFSAFKTFKLLVGSSNRS